MKIIKSIQALRSVAFLLIFCSHCTFIEVFSAAWGGIGVSIFIVLSGFMVTYKLDFTKQIDDLKALAYTWKRICKIFPLHILMLSIRLLFDYRHNIYTSKIVIFLNVTMLKSFVPIQEVYYSLGGATWYLTLIWVFALFTPLLLKIIKNNKEHLPRIFLIVVLFRVVWILAFHNSEISQWLTYVNPIFRLTDYFLGMLAGVSYMAVKNKLVVLEKHYLKMEIITWGILIVYVVLLSLDKTEWYSVYLRTFLSLSLISIFIFAECASTLRQKLIYENPLLIYIGNISFELFLIHIHVRNYVSYAFRKLNITNSILQLFTIFILSIVIAQLYCTVVTCIKRINSK